MTQRVAERPSSGMKIWGVLSPEDEGAGFDLVLDKSWYAVLLHKGKVITKLDPRDYTAVELAQETRVQLQAFCSKGKRSKK